ncbi:MAG: helix-turn-helix domain-containing protein [Gemmatimonadetes bacterium]|nr:helix-turn-helix domain-containing protein [Gemmatimonadota bacterium]
MSSPVALPTPDESELAREALRSLSRAVHHRGDIKTVAVSAHGGAEAPAEIPRLAFELLLEALGHIVDGNAVTLVPVHATLTTQQAAGLLNVSRPFVIKLLDQNELPYHKVGRHRRIKAEHLFAYKRRRDEASRRALSELSELGQDPALVANEFQREGSSPTPPADMPYLGILRDKIGSMPASHDMEAVRESVARGRKAEWLERYGEPPAKS